jgi:uncharacterized membrane protein
MKPFSLTSIAIALVFAVLMSVRGIKRKSLTKAGAICAFVVGFLSLACGLRGFLLLLFYVVSQCGMICSAFWSKEPFAFYLTPNI